MPWLTAGTEALGGIQDLLGLSGTGAQSSAISGLEGSPLFQALMKQRQEGILSSGSAMGQLRGGNIRDALGDARYSTLADVINNQLAQLSGLSGTGVGTAQSLGALGANSASNIGNLLQQGGAARAGGILGVQGVNNTGTNNILSGIGSLGTDLGLDKSIGGLLKGIGKLF